MYIEDNIFFNISFFNNSKCLNYSDSKSNTYTCGGMNYKENCCIEIFEMYYNYLLNHTLSLDTCYNYLNNTFTVECHQISEKTSMDRFIFIFGLTIAVLFFTFCLYLLCVITYKKMVNFRYSNYNIIHYDSIDENKRRMILLQPNPLYESLNTNY